MVENAWLRAFHEADRSVLADVYRDHHEAVYRTARRFLGPSDAENVTHDVFYRLLSDADLRRNFTGGHLRAWLLRVASNTAIGVRRRQAREHPVDSAALAAAAEASHPEHPAANEEEREATLLVERFRAGLPARWAPVFDARFLRQLPQRQAAAELGVHRTTLIYYEMRIRAALRRFLLRAS